MTNRMSVLLAGGAVIWLLNAAAMTAQAEESGRQADRPAAPARVERLLEEARKAQADPVKKAYAGWLNYLATQIEEKPDQTDGVVSTLTQWLERMETDPHALAELRGCHEWAYLSKVDGTGQPFLLSIPNDYDPQRSWPLLIFLHGRGMTHRGNKYVPNIHLMLHPLGRSRAGGYTALSEIDVLEVMAYVRRHWNIDPDRIHIKGGSMGGGGTFNMAARHPDLFASAQPLCGYYVGGAIENALNLPLYALHSRDDLVVPIVFSRMPTRRLAEVGGRVVLDEADAFGHKIHANKPAVERALRWAFRHTRQQAPRHVHLTATDELARRAYWTEIVEWGPAGRPAVVDARLDHANVLYLTLDNVAAAKLDLAESPVDRQDEMMVVINRVVAQTLSPPLPEDLYVIRQDGAWRLGKSPPTLPAERLHFPGGSMALFHGEPIMIVWGTGGDADDNARLHEIAQIARRSCNPSWPTDADLRDGVPVFYTLYGRLPGKPDVAVTTDDMARYNLLLLGDARQNAVVARFADRLPVKIEKGRVSTSDGFSWAFDNRALGLLYYNPLAPNRLIYWVASDTPDFYRPGTPLMSIGRDAAGPDFLLMHASEWQTVAARRFGSRWNWELGYGQSPLVSEQCATPAGTTAARARALRTATGADFALAGPDHNAAETFLAVGETRRMDVTARAYDQRISVVELTGQQLLAAQQRAEKRDNRDGYYRVLPEPRAPAINPERPYRVAVMPKALSAYVRLTRTNPLNVRLTDQHVKEALARFWPIQEHERNP